MGNKDRGTASGAKEREKDKKKEREKEREKLKVTSCLIFDLFRAIPRLGIL